MSAKIKALVREQLRRYNARRPPTPDIQTLGPADEGYRCPPIGACVKVALPVGEGHGYTSEAPWAIVREAHEGVIVAELDNVLILTAEHGFIFGDLVAFAIEHDRWTPIKRH